MLLTRTLLPLYFDIIIIHEWLQTQRIVQSSHNPTILFPRLTKVALGSLMQIWFFFISSRTRTSLSKISVEHVTHVIVSSIITKVYSITQFLLGPKYVSLNISSCQMSVFSFDLKNKKKMYPLDNYWQIHVQNSFPRFLFKTNQLPQESHGV